MLKFKTVNLIFALALLTLLIFDWTLGLSSIAYVLLTISYIGILAYGSAVLSVQFFLPVQYYGNNSSNCVAITFDDGPITEKTERILAILESYNVKAAFFCIGSRVEKNPELTRRIHKEGHIIGNHSYWHRLTFDLQTSASIHEELNNTDRIIQETIGERPAFFRPPYGVTNPMVASAVKKGGYRTIGWSLRPYDTAIKDGKVLMERVTRSLKGGDVILLHDYSNTTLEILPALLDYIEKVGLKIVRIDQLLNEKAYV